MKDFTKSENFNYDVVLYENINIDDIKSAREFIKALEKTKENPYISPILKKEHFSFVEADNGRLLITDSEGYWEIYSIAFIVFEDGSRVKIWANGSYWWIEAISPKEKKKEKYFYYTD